GKPAALEPVVNAAQVGRRAAGPLVIGDPRNGKPFKGDVGGVRIYSRALTPAEAETLARDEPIRYILSQDESKRSKEQKQRLQDYFLSYDAPPELRRVYAELNSLKAQQGELKKEIANIQVMAEMAKPRDTFVL